MSLNITIDSLTEPPYFLSSDASYSQFTGRDLIRNVFKTHVMNSLYTIVAVLAAIALIGSIGASLLQQAFALPFIERQFKDLTKQFQGDVLNLVASDPWGNAPDPERQRLLGNLFNDYEMATFRIFGLTPP